MSNKMYEVSKLLKVPFLEPFEIKDCDGKELTLIFDWDGLMVVFPNGHTEMVNSKIIHNLIKGMYKIKK